MRFIFCVSCVALLVTAMATGAPQDGLEPPANKPHYEVDDAPALFEKFIKDFNKTYKDDADRQVHYEAFRKSLKSVNELNADPKQTAWFDINHFADFTDEERKRMHGLRLP